MIHLIGMLGFIGLIGASAWYKRNKRVVWTVIGIASAGTATGVTVIAGQDTAYVHQIPAPLTEVIRLDLLATRDLDTSTPTGLPAGGTGDNKPLVSDQTWTRTGGDSCYPISATEAQCFEDSEVPYTVDSTGLGWVVEPSATNRILYSTDIDCTNWTCTGATSTVSATAPDGTADAEAITMAGGSIAYSAAAYTASAGLTFRMWAKCSAGTLDASNVGGAGHWTVDCATVAGAWAYLTSTHAAVTVVQAWEATGAGAAVLTLSGADATVWAPTLTEEPGSGLAVIPTAAAAVSTGDPAWTVDNSSTNYWRAWDTRTFDVTDISGECLVLGSTIRLSGLAGKECTGLLRSLSVSSTKSYPTSAAFAASADLTQDWPIITVRSGIAYRIDWGDGTIDNFVGTGGSQNPTHNYAGAGTYNIRMALDDPTALVNFYAYSNQLTGSIPDLSANTALVTFSAYSNQLTGSIPDLSANNKLVIFYVNSNQLTGSIPDLSANTALAYFSAYSNQLTGSIPDLSANNKLVNFYVNSNQLTGYTASTIAPTCTTFRADNNKLTLAAVDQILTDFTTGAAGRPAAGTINLSGGTNAAPTPAVKSACISALPGWAIATN